ncbi:MAG TPA: secretin N-terminal domain-containing protein [Candidatus Angelobacter sp.]|nr:secretin N-terminal domain-containing protein [Candidatus Angelobacter sp.]
MKTSYLKTISTCGLAVLGLIAVGAVTLRAQDAAASNNGPVYAPVDVSSNGVMLATNSAPAATTGTADTTATAPATENVTVTTNSVAADTNAPAATAAAPAAADTNAAPATADNTAAATPEATTNVEPAAVVIPTIVMDEVPLTDAIKNLARQAGLNYILDPKVSFGPPGADGRVTVPNISIRWENVTAEQALTTLLTTYSLQLVEDPKTKIARITVRDPAAPEPLENKIIQLKYASTSNMVVAVTTALTDKRSRVMGDVRTSQLVVLATEKELEAVDKMVESLDTPTRQVLIEARLLETSMNPSTVKGLDWSGTLQAQHLAFGNNLQLAPVPTESANPPLASQFPKLMFDTARGFNPATAFLDADGVNAVFSFLNQNSDARVISAPRTVTLDNETASLEVTRATPIINVTAGTANTTGGSSITYTNLGIILHVTPRISANNYVNLNVQPEVSRVFDTVTKVINGQTSQADEYDIRKIQTQVMIPSGHTLVLGGLVQDDIRTANTKVPILGDIPGLGNAFRSDSKSRQKNNLLVFITPTIVQDSDFQPTKSTFLQTPMQSTEGKAWSAWDSGKPADWHAVIHGSAAVSEE